MTFKFEAIEGMSYKKDKPNILIFAFFIAFITQIATFLFWLFQN